MKMVYSQKNSYGIMYCRKNERGVNIMFFIFIYIHVSVSPPLCVEKLNDKNLSEDCIILCSNIIFKIILEFMLYMFLKLNHP